MFRNSTLVAYISFILMMCTVGSASTSECDAFKDPLMKRGCEMREQLLPKFSEDGTASFPNWKAHRQESLMTDETDIFLTVDSDAPVSCGFGKVGQKVSISVRCFDNTTGIILSTHCHMASGFQGYGEIQYRVDRNKAKKRSFSASTDNRSLMLEGYKNVKAIVGEMMSGETMVVRFTPFNESRKEASFDISGLDKAIKPLRKACGW